MINLEKQKENFKNHVATLTDYGNIKILDFKRPESNEYRIRFLFEEDYCRLHISGDLGELTAMNYNNMIYEKFYQFLNDSGYFEQKVECHSRAFYYYDEAKASDELKKYIVDHGFVDSIVDNSWLYNSEEKALQKFLDDVMYDYDDRTGFSESALSKMEEIGIPVYEDYAYDSGNYVYDFGKSETGIVELYLLAFKLASEQLKGEGE